MSHLHTPPTNQNIQSRLTVNPGGITWVEPGFKMRWSYNYAGTDSAHSLFLILFPLLNSFKMSSRANNSSENQRVYDKLHFETSSDQISCRENQKRFSILWVVCKNTEGKRSCWAPSYSSDRLKWRLVIFSHSASSKAELTSCISTPLKKQLPAAEMQASNWSSTNLRTELILFSWEESDLYSSLFLNWLGF